MKLLKIISYFPILFAMISCGGNEDPIEINRQAKRLLSVTDRTSVKHACSDLEQKLLEAGLIDIQELDSTIKVDLKYSSNDNFLKFDVYGSMERAFLQLDVAQKLVNAQKYLREINTGFSLLVYDAVRPVSLQQIIWDSIKVPKAERGKYVANPKNGGSLHNFGAAVDVGIIDSTGKKLDMGCEFDYFGELAYPVSEAKFLRSGELSETQVSNRKLLRLVMSRAGFFNIQTEWWHFNSCRRAVAIELYKLIE